jgi:hypothetical protein
MQGESEIICAHWVRNRRQALDIIKFARRIAGNFPDEVTAAAALGSAAILCGTHLTPHATALARATSAAQRLDERLAKSAKFFNAEYRRRRREAQAKGAGFMTHAAAQRRLRRVMIDRLTNGETRDKTVFDEVFR